MGNTAGPTMRAIRLHRAGAIGSLALEDLPAPRPAPGEVLVRVHAAAITRDELDWPEDRLPAIPSYEVSGVVEVAGPGADLEAGATAFGLTAFDRDGVAAELAAIPSVLLAPKPDRLTHAEAAALPMAGLTSWQGLFTHGGLEAGQRVLITGASGGVGHVAAQLARGRGAVVVTGDPDEAPVDLVFDTAGGASMAAAVQRIRAGGRLVSVAEDPAGITKDTGVHEAYFVVEPDREQLGEIARLAEAGELRPAIDSEYPLADAVSAFERTEARGKRGKVVLRVAREGGA